MNINANKLERKIKYESQRKIYGKNLFVKNIFDFFISHKLKSDELILCTNYGLILSTFGISFKRDSTGFILDLDYISKNEPNIRSFDLFSDYIILFSVEARNDKFLEIFKEISEILVLISKDDFGYSNLLRGLDSLKNALMICDTDCNIAFANSNFCDNFHVTNRDEIIGMHINDVMKRTGIQIHDIETNSTSLKMFDVVKTGKPTLDRMVRMESKQDSNSFQLISNDMYPIINQGGTVSGLVEISRSQQQEIKKTRKIIGLNAEYVFDDVIGNSNVIKSRIKLAKGFSGNRGTVLITGESGVGKEIFAQSIHNQSSRRSGPFVALNCANFPTELIESELFGYVEGAFTGASKKGQIGKIELANGGTLFLDEIGELPYYFQSKLLRVLETWTITRIGGLKEIPVDVRLIAATNRDLPEMIKTGLFRQDLFYRLQVLTINIPPLRERIEDVPLIAEHFLNLSARQNGHPAKSLNDDAKRSLLNYSWPGNARELKNVMSRIDLLYTDEVITSEAIDFALFATEQPQQLSSNVPPEDRIEKCKYEIDAAYSKLLREALDITKGNKKNAADLLGISRKTIYRMLEKYNLE